MALVEHHVKLIEPLISDTTSNEEDRRPSPLGRACVRTGADHWDHLPTSHAEVKKDAEIREEVLSTVPVG